MGLIHGLCVNYADVTQLSFYLILSGWLNGIRRSKEGCFRHKSLHPNNGKAKKHPCRAVVSVKSLLE